MPDPTIVCQIVTIVFLIQVVFSNTGARCGHSYNFIFGMYTVLFGFKHMEFKLTLLILENAKLYNVHSLRTSGMTSFLTQKFV
jgi:hypothetical protein